MNNERFEALRNHVMQLAGKFGLTAGLRRTQGEASDVRTADPYIELTVSDLSRNPPLSVSAAKRETWCEQAGYEVFDDFILQEALPQLKPKG